MTSSLSTERGKALLEHVGGTTATALAREIAVRMELRPEQEKQRVKALRKALTMRGDVSIEICLEIEEIRGLAHGVIYRRMDDEELADIARLERMYGALPLDVATNGNGHKNGHAEREPHCTLVDDLRLDFSQRLTATVLSAMHRARLEAPPASAAVKQPEPTKVEPVAAIVADGAPNYGGSMRIDDALILRLLVPSDDGAPTNAVPVELPNGIFAQLSARGGRLVCDTPNVTIERSGNGYSLRYFESPIEILRRLIPED